MSIRCPHCHSETAEGSVFCGACGGALRADDLKTLSPTGISSARSGSALAPLTGGVTFVPTVNAMPTGSVFAARYRIDRLLGTGGMGTVYQAWDQELQVSVALKVIRPEI